MRIRLEGILTQDLRGNAEQIRQIKYLLSGLFFSFALSVTYLPMLLAIADGSDVGSYFFEEQHVSFSVLGTAITTFLNFAYIVVVRNSRLRCLNYCLIPLNIFCSLWFPGYLASFVSRGRVDAEGNVFAFALIFVAIPWTGLIAGSTLFHGLYLTDPKREKEITKGK